jgi:hypothetical protein
MEYFRVILTFLEKHEYYTLKNTFLIKKKDRNETVLNFTDIH